MSEAKLNIYQRLNKVREAVAYLQKDKRVGTAYMAITHDAVTAYVRPEFIKHGVMVLPQVVSSVMVATGTSTGKGIPFMRYEARFRIRFVNVDDPQDFADVELDAHALDEGDKAPGKAVSYATKYAMLKLLSIETGDDEESRRETGAVASDEAIQAACDAIADAANVGELKKHYAAAVKLFDGNKPALARVESAKASKLALAKKNGDKHAPAD